MSDINGPQIGDLNTIHAFAMAGGDAVSVLKTEIEHLKKELDELKKLVISHENELNDRKKIVNTYVDTILNKIEILKNIIKENIGNEETFISQHLIMVENIEAQIKLTGKISEAQFEILNEIYGKQKRV